MKLEVESDSSWQNQAALKWSTIFICTQDIYGIE